MWVQADNGKMVNLSNAIWVCWEMVTVPSDPKGGKQVALCAYFSENGEPVVLYRFKPEFHPSYNAVIGKFTETIKANGITVLEKSDLNCMST
jgi:hypothetical protein